VEKLCAAKKSGNPEAFPVKTKTLKRSSQSLWLLWATQPDGAVFLEQRPTPGVWAGLYCLPVFESYEALTAAIPAVAIAELVDGEVFKHVLTHKDLHIHPLHLAFNPKYDITVAGQWIAANEWPKLGLPAPIRKLLDLGE
jgi:A/G-specific adenine glycosylase